MMTLELSVRIVIRFFLVPSFSVCETISLSFLTEIVFR